MIDHLGDDFVCADAFRFAFEVEDDSMTQRWRSDGVDILARDVIATIEQRPAAAGGQLAALSGTARKISVPRAG